MSKHSHSTYTELDVLVVKPELFGDDEEHSFIVECDDGVAIGTSRDKGFKVQRIRMTYPKMAELTRSQRAEIREYRGFDSRMKLYPNDVMMCFGEVEVPRIPASDTGNTNTAHIEGTNNKTQGDSNMANKSTNPTINATISINADFWKRISTINVDGKESEKEVSVQDFLNEVANTYELGNGLKLNNVKMKDGKTHVLITHDNSNEFVELNDEYDIKTAVGYIAKQSKYITAFLTSGVLAINF